MLTMRLIPRSTLFPYTTLFRSEDFVYRKGMDEFQSLVEKEALKKGLTGGQPKFLDYARRFGIEWEPYADVGQMRFGPERSEEHTSELQSHSDLVCRLLLEKKKT